MLLLVKGGLSVGFKENGLFGKCDIRDICAVPVFNCDGVEDDNDDDDDDDVERKRRRKGNGDCELISAIPVFLHTPHRPPPLALAMQ